MPRTVKPFTPVPLKALKLSDVPDSAPAPFANQVARDETQKSVDEAVHAAYLEWCAAGKPHFTRSDLSRSGTGIKRKVYHFPPEHADAVKKMLIRAGVYNHVSVITSDVKNHNSGDQMIFWAVRDVNVRGPRGSRNGRVSEDVETG